jgi:NAD-dependent dihydropyrimidine dehydrogenase PreA subunit
MYAKVYIFYKTKPCQIFLFCPTENSSKTESFLLGKIQCKSKEFVIKFCNPCEIVPPQECFELSKNLGVKHGEMKVGQPYNVQGL